MNTHVFTGQFYAAKKAVCAAVVLFALTIATVVFAAPSAYAANTLTTTPQDPLGPISVYAGSGNFDPKFAKMADLPYALPSAQGIAFDTYTGTDGYTFSLSNDRKSVAVTHFKQEGTKVTTVKTVYYTQAQLNHCNGATVYKQGNEKYLFVARGGDGNQTAAMIKLSEFNKGTAKVYDVNFKNLDNESGKDLRGISYLGKKTITYTPDFWNKESATATKDFFVVEVGRRMNLAYIESIGANATFVCVDSQRFQAPIVTGSREGTAQDVVYHNGFLFVTYGDEGSGGVNKTCMIEAIKVEDLFNKTEKRTEAKKFTYSYSKTYSSEFTPEGLYFTSLDGDNFIYLSNNDANNKDAIFKGTLPATFNYVVPNPWKRLSGPAALDTMATITKEFGKASTAIVATNLDFKDSLAAAALAGGFNAPMLTTAKGSLSA